MTAIERQYIQGWGADLDRANRPAVPKEKRPPNGTGAHWTSLELQTPRVKVFKSIERPRMTMTHGSPVPPKYLSGLIRSFAYKAGENRMAHWLPLYLADRINVIEGIVEDLAKGHVPNILAEMGIKAELKYNKKGFAKKMAIVGGGALLLTYFFTKRTKTRHYS